MIGTKIYKKDLDLEHYSSLAKWCNANGCVIEDKGECYECVVVPTPSLDELKQAKLAELKSTRDSLEVEPVEYNGNLFDYDEKARERLRNKRQEIEDKGGSGTIPWALADDTEMVIGLQDFININNLATERAELLHFKYRTLKEQVNNATAIEEIEEIKWGEE